MIQACAFELPGPKCLTTLGNAISIEDLQQNFKVPSRVVTVKPGQEAAAERIARRSGADVVPFRLGDDQMYLAGRGLRLKGIHEGKAVTYQGKTGVVNGETLNRRNTFLEGCSRTGITMAAGTIFGIGAGLTWFLGRPTAKTLTILLSASGVAASLIALGGVAAAIRWVKLDSFSRVAK